MSRTAAELCAVWNEAGSGRDGTAGDAMRALYELGREDAKVIEPTKHTILVPAPVPVAVAERPWEREGWCDEQGRCWFCNAYSMGRWSYETPPNPEQDWGLLSTLTHALPHGAIPRPLPLPDQSR